MSNNLTKQWKLSELIPLVEKQDPDTQIDEQELIQYAQHIGIQLPEEQYMLFIAKEGIKENLPKHWKAFRTPSQQFQIVYRNILTGQIKNQHPLDEQYRQKVIMLRKELKDHQNQPQNQQYSQPEPLSEIAEEQNEFGNDSQIYDRRKPSIPTYNNLRQPITKEGIRLIGQTHNRQLSKLSQNSVIQKHIQQNSDKSSKKGNNAKLLPFSVVQKQNKNSQLEQYGTVFTQKVDLSNQQESSGSLGDQLKDQINRVKALKEKLADLEQQQRLKLALLHNLQQSNNALLEKIYKRVNGKKKSKDNIAK